MLYNAKDDLHDGLLNLFNENNNKNKAIPTRLTYGITQSLHFM